MCNSPQWLPALQPFPTNAADWAGYELDLYERFRRDLLRAPRVTVMGREVVVSPHVGSDGREETFWHLTSETKGSDRVLEPRRCERLAWIRCILQRCQNPPTSDVVWWKNRRPTKRGFQTRLLVAPADFSYVVVLTESGRRYVLLTAYQVTNDAKIRAEHCEYWRSPW